MAKLSSSARARLPSSDFVFPETRRYPIDTAARARNALSRVGAFGTETEKREVCSAVADRYPGIHAHSCPMHNHASRVGQMPSGIHAAEMGR